MLTALGWPTLSTQILLKVQEVIRRGIIIAGVTPIPLDVDGSTMNLASGENLQPS